MNLRPTGIRLARHRRREDRLSAPDFRRIRIKLREGILAHPECSMRRFFALALVVVVVASIVAADVSGKWKLDLVNQNGGTISMVVTFKQVGDKLTGTCVGEEFDDMTATGETVGDNVNWRCESNEGGEKRVATFAGSLSQNGSEMKGTWATVVKGSFSGTKQ
jgi:hypothetical protein